MMRPCKKIPLRENVHAMRIKLFNALERFDNGEINYLEATAAHKMCESLLRSVEMEFAYKKSPNGHKIEFLETGHTANIIDHEQ